MNNGDQLKKANETHLHHTALMLACQDLESATYLARKAREDLRRATACRMSWEERHTDARNAWTEAEPEDGQVYGTRVEFAAWALQDSKRNVDEKLEDYRSALKRVEVLGATVAEADSHEVPAYLRHRARKAIALADAFGNKVAMDATLHEGLDRPVLPELSPEVEVQEFRVIDPLEPVEAWTPPESRAVLVPVDDYTATKIQEGRVEAVSIDGEDLPEDRMDEVERACFWREVNGAALEDEEKALEATREDLEGEK